MEVDRHHRRRSAAGVEAVAVAANRAAGQMGPLRATTTLRQLNQAHGFDCMGCAWADPDPEHRSFAEFCENGAKAVAEEGTTRRADRAFFATHPVAQLATWSDYQLGQQGRITEPMVLREGGTHYEPISWDDAIALVASTLRGLDEPGPGGVLHQRPRVQRGRVQPPAVRPRVRHEQPAGLLEHVPRVDLRGARREHRHRQGLGEPAGHPRRPAHRHRRPEPGHQPPAHAQRPREGQGARRPHRRRQPTAGDRPDALRQPAEGQGPDRGRHRPGRRVPADPAQRRPRALPGHRRPARREGRRRPRLRRPPHDRLRDLARAHLAPRLGCRAARHGAAPRPDRARGRAVRGIRPHGHLLGDGDHPAPQRRRDDQGDHQRRAAPGQHRQARRRPVPGARPLQRAGRPHDGHLGEAAGPLRRAAEAGVRLRPADRARARRGQHRARDEGGAAAGPRSASAATSPRPPPTAR